MDPRTGEPSIRIVRPIGNWKFGENAQTDLDFPLPKSAVDLANLKFEPMDDDLPFFIPKEDEGGSGGTSGFSG